MDYFDLTYQNYLGWFCSSIGNTDKGNVCIIQFHYIIQTLNPRGNRVIRLLLFEWSQFFALLGWRLMNSKLFILHSKRWPFSKNSVQLWIEECHHFFGLIVYLKWIVHRLVFWNSRKVTKFFKPAILLKNCYIFWNDVYVNNCFTIT